MIKNEKQHQVTKARLNDFHKAIGEITAQDNIDPLFKELQISALRSQVEDFEKEIEDYVALKDGHINHIDVTFNNFTQALIKGRIIKGWSQAELAAKVGVKEQQIQRYEADDYSTANFPRLMHIAAAMDLDLGFVHVKISEEEIIIPGIAPEVLIQAREKLKARKSLII